MYIVLLFIVCVLYEICICVFVFVFDDDDDDNKTCTCTPKNHGLVSSVCMHESDNGIYCPGSDRHFIVQLKQVEIHIMYLNQTTEYTVMGPVDILSHKSHSQKYMLMNRCSL